MINNIKTSNEHQNANELILNFPYPDEEQLIYEGELINELFWNGEFYSVNNSGNKTSLVKIKEGNGKIKTYWDFKEFYRRSKKWDILERSFKGI